jgi:hypothetical protein
MDHYQVKIKSPSGMIYGTVRPYPSDEEKKQIPEGCVIVDDAILPKSYYIPEKELIDIPLHPHPSEYDQYVDGVSDNANDVSDTLGKGVKVDKLFRIGVADGYAYYVITQVNKKTCSVEWRGYYNMDRYIDHYFGWGRTVPLKDVERYVGYGDALKVIFGKKQEVSC